DSHISVVLRADQSRPAAESRGSISPFDYCFRRDLTSSQLDPASRSREYSSSSLIKQCFFFVARVCTATQQLLFFELPHSIADFSEFDRIKLRQLFQNLGFT